KSVQCIVPGSCVQSDASTTCSPNVLSHIEFPAAQWTPNVKSPETVGVPLITPDPAFKVRPVGNAPDVIVHTNGPVPFETKVVEYASPSVAGGSGLLVVIMHVP